MTYIQRKSIKEPPPYIRPGTIALDPDDYHARYVGWTSDRHQVFVTNVFVPAKGNAPVRHHFVRFVFDQSGVLVDMTVETFGPENEFLSEEITARLEELFDEFGPMKKKRIEFRPFRLTFDGVDFGLIVTPPDEGGDCATVEMHPGNTMSFHEPFNSGVYDT